MKIITEIGLPIGTASENLGLLINVEPKLKVSDNVFMGIRIAMAVNSQTLKNHDNTQFIIDDEFDHGFLSIIPTIDYYWQKENFLPYLGAGIGPYSLANNIDVLRMSSINSNANTFEVEVAHQIGFLVRGGFELGKGRFGLEYNFVPKTTLESPNEKERIGTVDSSYLGLTIGFVIGGR